jgi:hypothetical protein
MRFAAPALLTTVCLLAGCTGAGSMNTMLSAASPSPVPDVKDYRVTAKHYDEKVTRPDVRFHRLVDRLEVEAVPASGGGALTQLTVTARTFAELATHRGPTEEQERPSETVRDAAQKIVERCGGEVAPAPDAG